MTSLSYTVRSALLRLTEASQRTRTKLSTLLSTEIPQVGASTPPPAHVVSRLEALFDALGELAAQPDEASAIEMACEALQAELPSEALIAGLYDIDSDEVRLLVARGASCEQLQGASLPYHRCSIGPAAHQPVIAQDEGAASLAWLGDDDSTVLLCPIVHDTNLLGMLGLAEPLYAAQFDHHDVELVRYVAQQLADVIDALRQRRAASVASGRHG